MRISRKLSLAAAAILLSSTMLSFASSAEAYPTGQNMTVSANKYIAVVSTVISVQASHVFPGCKVSFQFSPNIGGARSATANRLGVTPAVQIVVPSRAGTYNLVAKTPSTCHRPYGVETATASIVVTEKPKKPSHR